MGSEVLLKVPAWETSALKGFCQHKVKYPVLAICSTLEEYIELSSIYSINILGIELVGDLRRRSVVRAGRHRRHPRRWTPAWVNSETLTTGVPLFGGYDDERAVAESPDAAGRAAPPGSGRHPDRLPLAAPRVPGRAHGVLTDRPPDLLPAFYRLLLLPPADPRGADATGSTRVTRAAREAFLDHLLQQIDGLREQVDAEDSRRPMHRAAPAGPPRRVRQPRTRCGCARPRATRHQALQPGRDWRPSGPTRGCARFVPGTLARRRRP